MSLPSDSHVHSEWSWDARGVGSMEQACVRAVQIGLPAIAFTEHLDHTTWRIEPEGADGPVDRAFTPPALDAAGYLEAVARCRERFPDLRILSGLEMGEPHWHPDACARVLGAGRFDRVLGSLHSLPDLGSFAEVSGLYAHRDAHDVVREYLAGVTALVRQSDIFSVLAHIDYPVRSWPTERVGPFDPAALEDEFREALRATAQAGRALEINTRLPLHGTILGWWHEEGGDAITFGSDAHKASLVGHGFAEAVQMAEAYGFRSGKNPHDLWARVD